jgi:SAM-dependent methyltransferase
MSDYSQIPSFRAQHLEVIRAALKHPYTAVSCHNEITTGNNYQSIDLEDVRLRGGRPHRNIFFSHVNFEGKRVLDIGANMGESSRLARRMGADLVDGYEYDKFFVETGRWINAAAEMTRVSLFQGDATDPRLYDGMRYDLVIAFSVWVYIDKVLDRIAQITNTVFFETHTLDHGLNMYLTPMLAWFPYVRLMGFEQQKDMKKSRAVLMFAKTREALAGALRLTSIRVAPYYRNTFFETFGRADASDLPKIAAKVHQSTTDDTTFHGIGVQYFALLMAGYHEFKRTGRVDPDNIFVRNYKAAISDGRIDQGLRYLLEGDEGLLARANKKFADIDLVAAGHWDMVPPIIMRPGSKFKFTRTVGGEIGVDEIDGHHRYFLAELTNTPTIDAMIGAD